VGAEAARSSVAKAAPKQSLQPQPEPEPALTLQLELQWESPALQEPELAG
jgi:hypothetical protein